MSFRSKVVLIGTLIAVIVAGVWLVARAVRLSPETLLRNNAVQQASDVNGEVAGSTAAENGASDGAGVTGRESVAPAEVNLQDVPSGPSSVDYLEQRYLAGEVDNWRNRGPRE